MKRLILITLVGFATLSSCQKDDPASIVELTSGAIENIKARTVTANGTISNLGNGISEHGHCWSTFSNPTIDDDKTELGSLKQTGNYISEITNLIPDSTYFIKAYCSSNNEIYYSEEDTFVTLNGLASVTTLSVSDITITAAKIKGQITDSGGGEIIERGFCWSEYLSFTYSTATDVLIDAISITDDNCTDEFENTITNLISGALYYFKAYAITNVDTTYGETINFRADRPIITGQTGTVSDYEGHVYNWIGIGKQAWLTENLYSNRYADGGSLPKDYTSLDEMLYWETHYQSCYYNHDQSFGYGRLYTFYAAAQYNYTSYDNPDHLRGICPDGWHLPSIEEWIELRDFLIASGYNYDGTKTDNKIGKTLASQSGWNASNNIGAIGYDTIANNTTGFNALPGGYLTTSLIGVFMGAGNVGYWWSRELYMVSLYYNKENLNISNSQSDWKETASVRCVRD